MRDFVYGLLAVGLLLSIICLLPGGQAWAAWNIVSPDAPPQIGIMTDKAIAVDKNTGWVHIAYGKDHLYHAWFDGAQWYRETVDSSPGVGEYAAIALDVSGKAHISYYDGVNENLKYATNASGTWASTTIDNRFGVGKYTSIALDSDGTAHISYYDEVNGFILYANNALGWSYGITVVFTAHPPEWSTSIALDSIGYVHISYRDSAGELKRATNKSGSWISSLIDNNLGPGEIGYTSIAIGASDALHISYYDNFSGALKYATDSSGSWVKTSLDNAGDVGKRSSLTLDSNGNVYISYYDATNGDLKYATNTSGTWTYTTLDNSGDVGSYSSIVLDTDDKLHICYTNGAISEIRYATNADGGWVYDSFDIECNVGMSTSLAIDENNKAHISYHDATNSDLKYATNESGFWSYTTLDSLGEVGEYSSIKLDASGDAHISYYDSTHGDLKYATNASGFWTYTTLDSTGDVGQSVSMALDTSGHAHVSYYNSTAYVLRYATNERGFWTYTTLDSSGSLENFDSIAVDASGNVHISFYDTLNKDLKYATNKFGFWSYTTLDSSGNVGKYNSIAVDASGDVHISYLDESNNHLKYVTNSSGSWAATTVDDYSYTGYYTSIAVDAYGSPHISYFDVYFGDMKYATIGPTPIIVDAEGNVGWFTSLSFDSNGYAHITYYDNTNGDLKYASEADILPPTTTITDPTDGGIVSFASYTVKGISTDNEGGLGMQSVDVSTDRGVTWMPATDTSSDGSWSTWEFLWDASTGGTYSLMSRGTDSYGNIEIPTNEVIVTVNRPARAGFSDDFESRFGNWTTIGFWHMVTDGSSPYPETHSPPNSMWFGQDSTGNYDTREIVYGEILSDWFYLPYGSTLEYWSWEETEDTPGYDTRKVYVSADNGATWTQVYESSDNSAAWHKVTVDLSAFTGMGLLKFEFDTVDRMYNNYRGWYVDDVSVYANPMSLITYPSDGSNVNVNGVTITGVAFDNSATGIQTVEVSTDGGGTWSFANYTGGSTWSYDWTPGAPGPYNVQSRATDNGGHIETPGTGITVTAVNMEPVTTITDPLDGSSITGEAYTITGTAIGSQGSAVTLVEVSTDGGSNWNPATGTDTWRYYLNPLPSPGGLTVLARAIDALAVLESTPASVDVTVTASPWTIQQVDPAGLNGWHTSITMDKLGRSHINYYDLTNMDLKYATNAFGLWTSVTVNDAGDWEKDGTIALDADGHAHIAYLGNGLKYAENTTGFWNITSLYAGAGSDPPIIDMDSAGSAHISFKAGSGPQMYATNAFGTWTTVMVNQDGHITWYGSMALDDNDAAHICYKDSTDSELMYATNAFGTWTSVVVDSSLSGIFTTDIAVDPAGAIHIASFDNTDTSIKYTTNASGYWTTETVDGLAFASVYVSIAAAADGTVRISYFDNTYQDLKYASNESGVWQKTTISTPGYEGSHNSLALDGKGGAHISYFGSDYTLHYATNVDLTMPYSVITDPVEGVELSGTSYSVNGVAAPGSLGGELTGVEVSTDGGNNWLPASDTSVGHDWSSWSYDWTLPPSGEYVITCRAKDASLNTETTGPGVAVTVVIYDTDPPTSTITDPLNSANITAASYIVTGTAFDNISGTGVSTVEISTNGGLSWAFASYTAGSWDYAWNIGSPGSHSLRSRATDNAGNIEALGPGVTVTVDAAGSPELVHLSWDAWLNSGNCTVCHATPNSFLSAGFREEPGFCSSCHNAASVAHERGLFGLREHPVFASVTTVGCRFPSYGNITSAEYDNRMYAHLMDGDKVVCVTCHNPIRKTEDMGRVWEYTTTSDDTTYRLTNGGWAGNGELEPIVYRDTSLWSGPSYVKDKKDYLVDGSEYTFNEYSGTVTFAGAQDPSTYVYVTIDYPYLRASNADNTLCSDCHAESTHAPQGGYNCLTCHSAHNTDNIILIRENIQPPRMFGLSLANVVFSRYTGANSYADADATYDGICEVCHTQTLYHKYDGSGSAHHNGEDCSTCHTHESGFAK